MSSADGLAASLKACLRLDHQLPAIHRAVDALGRRPVAEVTSYLDRRAPELAPLLFWHLDRCGLIHRVGDSLKGELRRRYHRNVARNGLLAHNLEAILQAFATEGIEVVVLKGASVLTAALGPFRGAFVLSDLDLLLRPEAMQRAAGVLIAKGFELRKRQTLGCAVKQAFRGRDDFTQVDLHSALFWAAGVEYRSFNSSDIWTTSSVTSVGVTAARLLSAEHQLCYRLVHDGIGHTDGRLLSNICRLYYFSALLEHYAPAIDWESLLKRLAGRPSARLLVAYVYYAHRELGLEIPLALRPFSEQAHSDLVLLDAVAAGSHRLGPYVNQTALALMGGRTVRESAKNLCGLLTPRRAMAPAFASPAIAVDTDAWTAVVKISCVQLIAMLYVGAYRVRHRRMA